MKEILANHPQVAEYAAQAISEAGLPVRKGKIRGEQMVHVFPLWVYHVLTFLLVNMEYIQKEWTSVQDMNKAAEVIVRICTIWEQNA